MELGVGEGDAEAAGVAGLEGALLTDGLALTPFVAGIEPNDFTLVASEERGGAEAGLDESGACGSAIDPNDNPAACFCVGWMLLGTLTPSRKAALEVGGPPRPDGLRECVCVGVDGWVVFAGD